jgi:hypothetical protein
MDKQTLLKIAEQLNCEYEIGLTSEINDFLENQSNVNSFHLSYEDNYFKVSIRLKEFGLTESKLLFSSLACFIEYTSTFYVREDFEDYFEYTLLSSMRSKKAFLCRVIFTS